MIRKYKGIELLIKSLPRVKSKYPESKFLIVGEPYISTKKYKLLAKKLQVDDMLIFEEKFIKTDYFLLTYGDGVSRINIKTLVQYHLSSKKVITFTAVRPPARFGEVKFYNDSNKIKSFEEKNKIDAGWINGGFFVINKEFFKYKNEYYEVKINKMSKNRIAELKK